MKKRMVRFSIDVAGYLPDGADAELLASLNDIITGVVGFTLEMNGMDGVQAKLNDEGIILGIAEDGTDFQTQEEKVVGMLQNANNLVGPDGQVEVDEFTLPSKKSVH